MKERTVRDIRTLLIASPNEARELLATISISRRIELMLNLYEALNAETSALLDLYVEEVEAPRCPGVPQEILRAQTVERRAGQTLNFAEVLRFLRHARVVKAA
jgi:hypothetical protein